MIQDAGHMIMNPKKSDLFITAKTKSTLRFLIQYRFTLRARGLCGTLTLFEIRNKKVIGLP